MSMLKADNFFSAIDYHKLKGVKKRKSQKKKTNISNKKIILIKCAFCNIASIETQKIDWLCFCANEYFLGLRRVRAAPEPFTLRRPLKKSTVDRIAQIKSAGKS